MARRRSNRHTKTCLASLLLSAHRMPMQARTAAQHTERSRRPRLQEMVFGAFSPRTPPSVGTLPGTAGAGLPRLPFTLDPSSFLAFHLLERGSRVLTYELLRCEFLQHEEWATREGRARPYPAPQSIILIPPRPPDTMIGQDLACRPRQRPAQGIVQAFGLGKAFCDPACGP